MEKVEGRKIDLTQKDVARARDTSMNAPVDTAPTDWVSSEDAVPDGDERLQTPVPPCPMLWYPR